MYFIFLQKKKITSLVFTYILTPSGLSKTSSQFKSARPHLKCHFLNVSQHSSQRRNSCQQIYPPEWQMTSRNSKLPLGLHQHFHFESCEYLLFYQIYHSPLHIQRGAGTAHKKQNNKEIYSKLPAKNASSIYNHPQKTDATTERKE